MRQRLFFVGLALALFTAADYPALPDGGSLITPSLSITVLADGGLQDAGYPAFVTVDTAHVADWVATMRCDSAHGSPRSYYRFSADGGTARAVDQLLDLDRTFDIPVQQTAGVKVRWLSFLGEDGGAPWCNLQHQTVPSQ